jgi:hypothetical protein
MDVDKVWFTDGRTDETIVELEPADESDEDTITINFTQDGRAVIDLGN